jgi:toxin-antitoxin system PIN domain toxin
VSAALLDVNVLIALLDGRHVHHEQAHEWFAVSQARGWATCPLTQNAVLRILGQPRYPNSPGSPAVVARLMQELIRHPRHRFWPDAISLLAAPEDKAPLVDATQLLEAGQLTDAYLLALAVHHGGTLVSFDRRLGCGAVVGGSDALQLIPT